MSIAVGETHGNDARHRFTNPEGVEFGLAADYEGKDSTPSGSTVSIVGCFLSVGCTHG